MKDEEKALVRTGLDAALEHAAELIEQSAATNTRRAYEADWRAFIRWAESTGVSPALPVDVATCAAWLADMEKEGKAVATIRRRARGLAHEHSEAGLESPTKDERIRKLLAGIARRRADAGDRPKRKRALAASMVRVALPTLSKRDKAIVLTAMVTALRRSNLAALRWEDFVPSPARWRDIEPCDLIAWVRKSKTDQVGEGRPVAVPCGRGDGCPVRALRDLRLEREMAGEVTPEDRVFRCSEGTIAQVIKRTAKIAGEDPRQFGAHSTRAGMMTTASEAGVDMAAITRQSGHNSMNVAMTYIRPAEQARNPAARAVVDSLDESEDHGQ